MSSLYFCDKEYFTVKNVNTKANFIDRPHLLLVQSNTTFISQSNYSFINYTSIQYIFTFSCIFWTQVSCWKGRSDEMVLSHFTGTCVLKPISQMTKSSSVLWKVTTSSNSSTLYKISNLLNCYQNTIFWSSIKSPS